IVSIESLINLLKSLDGETKEEIVEKVFIEEDIQRLNRRKGEGYY
ncbi:MAG: hypothetical protein JRI44_13520, partial [Deltaproteobacteria bacterium]|nr:hypothetical protein [Deltaproteobacteria bacterium]